MTIVLNAIGNMKGRGEMLCEKARFVGKMWDFQSLVSM